MRRDKDIIGYMYNDTEDSIKRQVMKDLKEMACEKCQMGYGVIDENLEHASRCTPAIKAYYMLSSKYFAKEIN